MLVPRTLKSPTLSAILAAPNKKRCLFLANNGQEFEEDII